MKKITVKDLEKMEGMSEDSIAFHFGITRMGLYKIRKRLSCPKKHRSDKGKKRYE